MISTIFVIFPSKAFSFPSIFLIFPREFSHFLRTIGSHSWVLSENAKKNLVFHFGVGRQASFLKIGYVCLVFVKKWKKDRRFDRLKFRVQFFRFINTLILLCPQIQKNPWRVQLKHDMIQQFLSHSTKVRQDEIQSWMLKWYSQN